MLGVLLGTCFGNQFRLGTVVPILNSFGTTGPMLPAAAGPGLRLQFKFELTWKVTWITSGTLAWPCHLQCHGATTRTESMANLLLLSCGKTPALLTVCRRHCLVSAWSAVPSQAANLMAHHHDNGNASRSNSKPASKSSVEVFRKQDQVLLSASRTRFCFLGIETLRPIQRTKKKAGVCLKLKSDRLCKTETWSLPWASPMQLIT